MNLIDVFDKKMGDEFLVGWSFGPLLRSHYGEHTLTALSDFAEECDQPFFNLTETYMSWIR